MQFAMEANVSMSSVQRWESGKLPPVRELMRLADLLGVETDELVEIETPSTQDSRLAALADRFERIADALEGRLDAQELPQRERARK